MDYRELVFDPETAKVFNAAWTMFQQGTVLNGANLSRVVNTAMLAEIVKIADSPDLIARDEVIEEILYITSGKLEAQWIDNNGNPQQQTVKEGDLIRVGNSPHTFLNQKEQEANLVVFRFVPDGKDKRSIIKDDKVIERK